MFKFNKTSLVIIVIIGTTSLYYLTKHMMSRDSWKAKKGIYTELIDIIGKIRSNPNNSSELIELANEFNHIFQGKMIHAEDGKKDLLIGMMDFKKHLDNTLEGTEDVKNKNALAQSGIALIKEVSRTINKGDFLYLNRVFLILTIGTILLITLKWKEKLRLKHKSPINDSIKEAIINLIGHGKTNEAIELLEEKLKSAKSEQLSDIILIKGRFVEAKQRWNTGIIEWNEFDSIESKTNNAILDFVNT